MIIHKLILRHLSHRDDPQFYLFQAQDAIRWIERQGVRIGAGVKALDLGCGHGIFGAELLQRGCAVVFADYGNGLLPELKATEFREIDIDREPLAKLGEHDLVICSNVLEHLAKPSRFIESIPSVLSPGGVLYLSWTNWLSPWGGPEFSPFHFLGPQRGHLIYDRLIGQPRIHTPYVNLFPTYIGQVLREIRKQPRLRMRKIAPRYYPEFSWLSRIPVLREFLVWNSAIVIERPA